MSQTNDRDPLRYPVYQETQTAAPVAETPATPRDPFAGSKPEINKVDSYLRAGGNPELLEDAGPMDAAPLDAIRKLSDEDLVHEFSEAVEVSGGRWETLGAEILRRLRRFDEAGTVLLSQAAFDSLTEDNRTLRLRLEQAERRASENSAMFLAQSRARLEENAAAEATIAELRRDTESMRAAAERVLENFDEKDWNTAEMEGALLDLRAAVRTATPPTPEPDR